METETRTTVHVELDEADRKRPNLITVAPYTWTRVGKLDVMHGNTHAVSILSYPDGQLGLPRLPESGWSVRPASTV